MQRTGCEKPVFLDMTQKCVRCGGTSKYMRRLDNYLMYRKSRMICNLCDIAEQRGEDIRKPTTHSSKQAVKLAKMLIDLGIPVKEPYVIKRLRPSSNDRAHGAWVWVMELKDSLREVGSSNTVKECIQRGIVLLKSEFSFDYEVTAIYGKKE